MVLWFSYDDSWEFVTVWVHQKSPIDKIRQSTSYQHLFIEKTIGRKPGKKYLTHWGFGLPTMQQNDDQKINWVCNWISKSFFAFMATMCECNQPRISLKTFWQIYLDKWLNKVEKTKKHCWEPLRKVMRDEVYYFSFYWYKYRWASFLFLRNFFAPEWTILHFLWPF